MMHGIAWYCMVLHCIAWYYMILHGRKTRVGERLVRSFSHQTRDRKELATKQFVIPELKINQGVFGVFLSKKTSKGFCLKNPQN